PTPAWERAWKWTRRHPTAAAAVNVSALAVLIVLVVVLLSNASLHRERDAAEGARQQADANAQVAQQQRERAQQERERADRSAEQSEDTVRRLTELAQERLALVPGMDRERRELLEYALQFWQNRAAQQSSDPQARFEAARASWRVGEIYRLLREDAKAQKAL